MSHSREFIEYLYDIQPNANLLFLIDTLMGNIDLLAKNLPPPKKEEESNIYQLHSFMLQMGQRMPAEQYHRWWIEVWITRSVDSLQYYLSQILFRIYKERPDTLKASENKVEVREVLEAGSIEEIINNYVEQKVSALAYKGLSQLIEYLNRNLGIGFDTKQPDFQAACEVIEIRNIIVHNRGRVSRIFLQRLPSQVREGLCIGDPYPLDLKYALNAGKCLQGFADKLDTRIVEHFKFEPWPPHEVS